MYQMACALASSSEYERTVKCGDDAAVWSNYFDHLMIMIIV